jgi:hypothetical protein
MLVLAVLVLAVLPCRCYVRPARAIDAACSLPTGCIELGSAHLQESRERALRDAYRVLPSFGSVREPPHAPRDDMLVAELEEISGLPAAAFAPSVPAKSAVPNNLPAASAAVCIQLLLAAAALSDSQPLAEAKRGLRGMDWWQISPLFLGLASGSVLLAAVVDKLLLRGAVLTLFTRLVQPPARREAVLRHEAGHFLLSHLLGFPVQACELDPLAALVDRRFGGAAGTIYQSPAMAAMQEQRRFSREQADRAAIVLMAGIAAEALAFGGADGGAADEAALRRLLVQEASQTCEPGGGAAGGAAGSDLLGQALRARARWAAANAVSVLQEQQPAYEALCEALRRGESVGECAVALDTAWAGGPASDGET